MEIAATRRSALKIQMKNGVKQWIVKIFKFIDSLFRF